MDKVQRYYLWLRIGEETKEKATDIEQSFNYFTVTEYHTKCQITLHSGRNTWPGAKTDILRQFETQFESFISRDLLRDYRSSARSHFKDLQFYYPDASFRLPLSHILIFQQSKKQSACTLDAYLTS